MKSCGILCRSLKRRGPIEGQGVGGWDDTGGRIKGEADGGRSQGTVMDECREGGDAWS